MSFRDQHPLSGLSTGQLLTINILALYSLLYLTYTTLQQPHAPNRSVTLTIICFAYLGICPLLAPHRHMESRLLLSCIAWALSLRTWEIRNNEHLARSISGSFRHYMGFIHGFIDRKNPYVPNPHERWSRARTRLARGFFKLSLFHVVASTFPQLSGKGASMFWHEETNGHTSRAIVSLLMGFSIYFWMGGLADIIFTLVELILKVRTRDMFNQPYLSTSLRAFWRWRWNATVQESLEKAVTTDGVEDSVRYTEDQSERKQKQAGPRKGVVMRRPFRDVALAAFKVFFLSGVLHDHVNWIAFGDAPYRNIIFFMLQFVVVALEMGLSKSLIYKSMPSLVRWSAVVLFAAWTGPTFVGPYMRNGGLAIFPMPKWGMPAWWPTLTL